MSLADLMLVTAAGIREKRLDSGYERTRFERWMTGGVDEARLASAMAGAQSGDGRRYQQLLSDCIPFIRDVARGTGVRPESLDDVIQECLIAVHAARHTYDPARPFLPWLRAIARRRAIDLLRRTGRQGRRELHDPIAYETAPDEGTSATDAIDRSERARVLAEAVRKLPAAQRQAVEHLALGELSLAETAAVTGRTTGALKVNLHRALHSLRGLLFAPDRTDALDHRDE